MGDREITVVNDLDSLAVQFGQSLMESDWKQYNNVKTDDLSDSEVAENNNSAHESEDCSKSSFAEHSENHSVEFDLHSFETDSQQLNENSETGAAEKKFTCKDCGLSYNKSSSFSNHRLAHHPSICPHCGRRFSMKSSLESHLQLECGLIIKTSTNSFECHICKKILSSKKILSRHLRRHTGVGKFTCRYCTKIFTQKSNLDSHMQTHEKIKPFKCTQCCMTFSERSTVVRHVKRQHGMLEGYSTCIESTLKPASQVDLANKMTVHGFNLFAGNENGESPVESPKTVDKNEAQSMTSLKSLLEKPPGSSKTNDFVNLRDYYKELDKASESSQGKDQSKHQNLMDAKSENTETEPDDDGDENESSQKGNKKTYCCKLCDKVYNHSSSLAKHMKGHLNAHNLMCQICQTQFHMKRELLTHMSLHYGGKRHCCPLCDVKFAGRSSILRHLRRSHKYSHEGARECLKVQEQENEVDTSLDYENYPELANENGSEDGSEYSLNAGKHLETEKVNTNHEYEESENSLDVTVLNSNKAEEISHYTCSLCQQIFLEKSEWKTHLCLLHRLSPDEADERMKLEESANFESNLNYEDSGSMNNYGLDNKFENDGMEGMGFGVEKDDSFHGTLFDGALNVTLEKDENGIQKVVKVMPELCHSVSFKPIKEALNKPFCCDICNTRFVEKSSVRRHLKRTHKFTAEEAREYMVQATYTKDPIKNISAEVKPDISDSNETAEVANDSNFMDDDDESVKQIDNFNQTYACTICRKRFMLRSSVRRHLRKIHHFTHEESRNTVIPAEISSGKRFQLTRTLVAPDDVPSESFSTELTCKFCEQKFMKRYNLRSHLIATHSFTAEKAEEILDEEDDDDAESIEANHKCGLCLAMFKKRSSLKFHLMKLHRLSEIVAERILVGEQRKDYTEGLEDEIGASFMDEGLDESYIKERHERFNYTPGLDDEQSDSDDYDDDMDSVQEIPDYKLDIKKHKATIIVDKDTMLAEMNFNAINPWGTEIKPDPDLINAENLVVPGHGKETVHFMMSENEKLLDSRENTELTKVGPDICKDETFKPLEKTSISGFSLPRVYDCPICGKIMSDASARAKHIRRHEGMTGFKCQICDKVYRQVRLIESHIKTHSGVGLKCGVCFIYCAERHSAKRHLRRIHNIEPNTDLSEKSIQQCTKDIPDGLLDSGNHYTVLNLAEEKDFDGLVTNATVKIEQNENETSDAVKLESDTDKMATEMLTETEEKGFSENDENENVFSNYLLKQSVDDSSEKECNEENEAESIGKVDENKTDSEIANLESNSAKGGKKAFKIDSVINNLRKKLNNKDKSENENEDQSDVESQTELETPSMYSANNFSPLKFKFTKKMKPQRTVDSESVDGQSDLSFSKSPFKVSNLLGKRSHCDSFTTDDEPMDGKSVKHNTQILSGVDLFSTGKYTDIGESTGYEGSDNESDSDKTVDFEYDENNFNDEENDGNDDGSCLNSGQNERSNIDQDVALLDQELLKAFMPQMTNNSSILENLNKNKPVNMETTDQSSTCETDTDRKKNKPVKHLECWECNKKYSNYKSYREHRRKKHPLSCNICRQVFVEIILYQSHMESHARGAKVTRNHDCPVCGKEFKDASSRAKHIRLHTGEKPYRCEVCGKRFTQTGHLQSHMRIHNGEKPFDCKLCGKYFTEKSSVKRHLRKMHYNQYNKKCGVCGIISRTREEHRDHLVTHKLKVYSCQVCSKDFIDSRALKVHTFNAHSQITHSLSLREYRCNECNKQFFSTKGLKNHVRRHKNPLPTYKCSVCKKQFMHLSILKNHMNSHFTKKEYFCEECGKCFHNSAYLTVHKKYHIIEKLNQIALQKKGINTLNKENGTSVDDTADAEGVVKQNQEGSDNTKVKEETLVEKLENGEKINDNVKDREQDKNSEESLEKNTDTVNVKIEPDKENDNLIKETCSDSEIITDKEVNLNDKEDIDIESIQESFSGTMVKVQKFKLFSCYYFFKSKETKTVQENKVSTDGKTIITLGMDKHNNKWLDDGMAKSRCLTVYQCNQCRAFQLTKRNMMRHQDSVHQARKFQCSSCSSQFSSKVMLQLHLKRFHTNEVFKCPQCPKTFTERYSLRRHEKRHSGKSGELPYECMTCHKRFISRYTLLFHMESHNARRLQCKKCGTKFVHQRSYDNHQRAMCVGNRKRVAFRKLLQHPPTSLQIQPKYLACKYCPMSYNHITSMEDHVRCTHPEHEGEISAAYSVDQNNIPDIDNEVADTHDIDNINDMTGLMNNTINDEDENVERTDSGKKAETVGNSLTEMREAFIKACHNEIVESVDENARDVEDIEHTDADPANGSGFEIEDKDIFKTMESVKVKVEHNSAGYSGRSSDVWDNNGGVLNVEKYANAQIKVEHD